MFLFIAPGLKMSPFFLYSLSSVLSSQYTILKYKKQIKQEKEEKKSI